MGISIVMGVPSDIWIGSVLVLASPALSVWLSGSRRAVRRLKWRPSVGFFASNTLVGRMSSRFWSSPISCFKQKNGFSQRLNQLIDRHAGTFGWENSRCLWLFVCDHWHPRWNPGCEHLGRVSTGSGRLSMLESRRTYMELLYLQSHSIQIPFHLRLSLSKDTIAGPPPCLASG